MTTVADSSFLLFVYPFLFDATEFQARADAIETADWQVKGQVFPVWKTARFPGQDMLAYVASYLNPLGGSAHATARLWKLNEKLEEVYGLAGRADWWLQMSKEGIPFRLGEVNEDNFAVQFALFRVGVGFLTVQVKPKSEEVSAWQDFLHHFRFVRGRRGVGVRALKSVGFDKQKGQPVYNPFYPEPAGGVAQHPDGVGEFDDLLNSFLRTGALGGETEPWWREVFVPEQVIPFAVLFIDGSPKSEDLELIYKVRNFFHSQQGENPAPEDLQWDHSSLLPYSGRQWFIFSLNGGSFLACDAPDTQFFRQDLPKHLREQYFILFLLTLHQRFVLMSLSQQVSDNWLAGDETARAQAFERIRDTLLDFTARGHFTQVMQREHHHRCYRKWQEIFQISQLYQEVRGEIREMHDYLQMKRTERIRQLAEERQQQIAEQAFLDTERERAAQERARHLEERLSLLGIIIGVPALVLSFLSINLIGITTKEEGLPLWKALLISIGGVVLGMCILWFVRKGGKKKDAKKTFEYRQHQSLLR